MSISAKKIINSHFSACITIKWNFPQNKSEVSFSERTMQFQNRMYEWRNCVVNYTSGGVLDDNLTNGSKICNLCKTTFDELFGYYWKIYTTPDVDFCVDVETTMNDTIHLWDDVWKCAEKQDRNRDLFGIMITFGTLLLLTALFYAASYIQGGGETRRLIQCKIFCIPWNILYYFRSDARLSDPHGQRSRLLSSGMSDADLVSRVSPGSSVLYNVPIHQTR